MKKIIAILALGATAATLGARELTPEQAIERALSADNGRMAKLAPAKSLKLVYTQLSEQSRSAAYLFNNSEEGYLIVSADDRAFPLLGYSESGSIDPENIPDNMRAWLQGYAAEIDCAASSSASVTLSAPSAPLGQAIAPLVATRWDQGDPYNALCPTINNRATYTGCVATAMAQVMKYHQWPPKATGSISYSTETAKVAVTCDFSKLPLDWAAMTNTYDASSSVSSCLAVAELMFGCGASVKMDYNTYSSGASSSFVPEAAVDYFGYDPSATFYERVWFTTAEWEQRIYDQLANVGPVYYGGYNSQSGHAFVCDGYDGNGFFHFNWGWSGMSDGYFRLSALDPGSQGAGGSAEGYTMWQTAVFDIQKPQANSQPSTLLVSSKNVSAELSDGTLYISGGFYNRSSRALPTFTLGLKARNVSDGSVSYVKVYNTDNLARRSGYDRFGVKASQLANYLGSGTFDLSVVYKAEGDEWLEPMAPLTSVQNVRIRVIGTSLSIIDVDNGKIVLNGLNVMTPIREGGLLGFDVNLYQESWDEANCTVYPIFFDGSNYIFGNAMEVFLPKYENKRIQYVGTLPSQISEGSYTFMVGVQRFFNQTNLTDLTGSVPVKVLPKQSVDFTFANSTIQQGPINSADLVINSDITATADFFGYFDGWLFDGALTRAVTLSRSQAVSLKGGSPVATKLHFNFANIDISQSYYVAIYARNNVDRPLTTYMPVKFDYTSADGLLEMIAPERASVTVGTSTATIATAWDIAGVTLCNAMGAAESCDDLSVDSTEASFSVERLTKGVHIAIVTGVDGQSATLKFIVK